MPNILTALNATYVNELTQEQIDQEWAAQRAQDKILQSDIKSNDVTQPKTIQPDNENLFVIEISFELF